MSSFSSNISKQEALTGTQLPQIEALTFTRDELGEGFHCHWIEMGKDPDGQTPVRFALVRYVPEEDPQSMSSASQRTAITTQKAPSAAQKPALLFVHGMTDYFFQAHLARFFSSQGFAVYGIDLRKCGRAWRAGQSWHHVTDQKIYDTDLTIATALLATSHPKVFICGHSTGGLNVTMWAARLHRAAIDMPESPEARLISKLGGVILNSPWFGLQFDPLTTALITRVFPFLARIAPSLPLPGGVNPLYGRSLHSTHSGEWSYNLTFKPLHPRPKMISWLVGVVREIDRLQSGNYSTGVPTLLLCSDKHSFKKKMGSHIYHSDIILKPSQMRQFTACANKNTEIIVIPGAMHDVFLSREPIRSTAMETTAQWLKEHDE